MIKKLQALKAKKGFTLVELVVVIAIIGVLAAILVPTMMGVVQDSQISSADTAAAQVRNQTTAFLTKLNSNSITMKTATDFTLNIAIAADGTWSLTGGSGTGDWLDGTDHWGSSSSTNTDKEVFYVAYMRENLSDLKSTAVAVHFSNGKCLGVTLVSGATSLSGLSVPALADFKGTTTSVFTDKAGVSGSTVVGTAPKLGKAT